MEQQYYHEMVNNLDELIQKGALEKKSIYLFGHCNATEELLVLLQEKEVVVAAILDNNVRKWGKVCKGVSIVNPESIIQNRDVDTVVCIASRAYPAMCEQLYQMGFKGKIYKLVDYNTYAEYSLSPDVIENKRERVRRGMIIKKELEQRYPGHFKILCPFAALGDVFFTMSYLPNFLSVRQIEKCVICVSGGACKQVAELFGLYPVEGYPQKELDELVQACLHTKDFNFFISHQDRPYVVNLHKALYIKCISLELIYKSGVFGLPLETQPYRPVCWKDYPYLNDIVQGKAVIFAPYAKSVVTFKEAFWQPIVADYLEQGYQCFTNVAGDERPLEGTRGISPQIAEMKSVVERAGTFIGIRSGLCDVVRDAACRKLALYPDYYYSDTKWKAIDMYAINGWENIAVDEEFVWSRN